MKEVEKPVGGGGHSYGTGEVCTARGVASLGQEGRIG